MGVQLRKQGYRCYYLGFSGGSAPVLRLHRTTAEHSQTLQKKPLAPPVKGESLVMELRAVGKTLIAKWQDVEQFRAEDETLTEAGSIWIGKGLYSAAEFLDLSATASAPAAATNTSRRSPSSEPWQNLLQDPSKLSLWSVGNQVKVEITGGELVLPSGCGANT